MFPFGGFLASVPRILSLSNLTVIDFVIFPNDASATGGAGNNGSLVGVGGRADEWINSEYKAAPSFNPGLYECGYFSVTGDTSEMTGPTVDQYHNLAASQTWNVFWGGLGQKEVTGTLRIREVANPANEVTATMTIRAQVDPDI